MNTDKDNLELEPLFLEYMDKVSYTEEEIQMMEFLHYHVYNETRFSAESDSEIFQRIGFFIANKLVTNTKVINNSFMFKKIPYILSRKSEGFSEYIEVGELAFYDEDFQYF